MKSSFTLRILNSQAPQQPVAPNVIQNLESSKQSDYFVQGSLPPINRQSNDSSTINFKSFKITGLQENTKASQSTVKNSYKKETEPDCSPTYMQDQINLQTSSFVSRTTLKNEQSLTRELKKIYHPASIKQQNLETFNEIYQKYDEEKKCIQSGVLSGRHFQKFLKPMKDKASVNVEEEMKAFQCQREKSLINLQKKLQVANVLFNVKYNVFEKNRAITNMVRFYQIDENQNSMKSAQFYSNLKTIFLKKKKLKQLLDQHYQEMETTEKVGIEQILS